MNTEATLNLYETFKELAGETKAKAIVNGMEDLNETQIMRVVEREVGMLYQQTDNKITTAVEQRIEPLATKENVSELKLNLANFRTELKGDISNVREEIVNVKAELKGDISTVRKELNENFASKTDLANVKSELKEEITNVKSELKGEIADVRKEIANLKSELKGDIADVKSELKEDIANVRKEITNVKSELKEETSDLKQEISKLEQKMNTQFLWIMGVMITILLSIVGSLVSFIIKFTETTIP